jgi:putative hydrolase of the HAD superfamily
MVHDKIVTTVVFDLDDTLYDEIDFVRSGFRSVAQVVAALSEGHGPDDVFAAIWDCFIAGERGSTFDAALECLGVPYDAGLISRLVEVYRTHVPPLTLSNESRTTLDILKDRYTLGLLTDGYLPTQRLKVQSLGIEPYFAAIVYTEELGRDCWKPSPRGFERLMELLHARPEQMAYVADNEAKDFIAPNRLGMLTIQLVRPRGLHTQTAPEPDAAPKLRIDRIDKLPPILAGS